MWLNMNQLIDLSMRHRSLKQPEISNLPLRGTYWLQRREVITYFSVRRLYAYVGRRIVLLIIAYKVDRLDVVQWVLTKTKARAFPSDHSNTSIKKQNLFIHHSTIPMPRCQNSRVIERWALEIHFHAQKTLTFIDIRYHWTSYILKYVCTGNIIREHLYHTLNTLSRIT